MNCKDYIKKLSNKKLIKEFEELYCTIHICECFNTKDLILYDFMEKELWKRGYEVKITSNVKIEKREIE